MAVAKAPAPKTSGTVQAFMTLYGYVDNSPPGAGIAHPCIHQEAGGSGTYADPITFATDASELPWCEIVYVPYMERYFIHEDECSECDHDWRKLHKYRFDMWAGGDAGITAQAREGGPTAMREHLDAGQLDQGSEQSDHHLGSARRPAGGDGAHLLPADNLLERSVAADGRTRRSVCRSHGTQPSRVMGMALDPSAAGTTPST